MSWDVSIQRLSQEYEKVEDIPQDEQCLPIGSIAEVQAAIAKYFPGTDWSDPTWGIYDSEIGSIEFNLGAEEPSNGFMMHIRAGVEVVAPLVGMCQAEEWQAIDCSSGEFLERSANPESSLEQWHAYRDQIVRGA